MIQQLDNSLALLGARYRASGLPKFFEWWSAELRPLVPASIKRRCYVPREKLLMRIVSEQMELWRVSEAGVEKLDDFSVDSDSTVARERVVAALERFEEGVPAAVYCLPANSMLRKTIRLPVAAEANLLQAVMFEIDRQTPFSTNDVYHDVKIIRRDPPFMDAELLIVLKRDADKLIEHATRLGLDLQSVDVDITPLAESDALGPQPEHVNLLPPDRRARKANKRVLLNWALAVGVLLLLACLMAESLYLRNLTVTQLETQRVSLRKEALAVNELKNELDDSLGAANFLASQRELVPLTLDVLAETTQLIPVNTWVQRFQIDQTELQLQGLSDSAQQLVRLLNDSNAFDDTSPKGAFTTDQRLNKERFTVAAVIDPMAAFDVATDTPLVDEQVPETEAVNSNVESNEVNSEAEPVVTNKEEEDAITS